MVVEEQEPDAYFEKLMHAYFEVPMNGVPGLLPPFAEGTQKPLIQYI